MKRFLILLLLPLLLAGCGKPDSPGESTPSIPQTLPEESGLYDPDSVIEQETGGAVTCYPLDDDTYNTVHLFGSDLLLCSRDNTRLTLLAGEKLIPSVEKNSPFHIGYIQTGSDSIAYADEQAGVIIFLNAALREMNRLKLPEDMIGQAQLSPQWDQLYYCTAAGLRALDLQTGISRLVTGQQAADQSVTGVFCDGTVVRCEIRSEDGSSQTRLIASENGEVLWEGSNLTGLATAGEHWFACIDRGSVQELLFGRDGQVRNLWLDDTVSGFLPFPENNAVLAYREASWGCQISYYDLTTGYRTDSIRLPGISSIQDICPDASGQGIWLLCRDAASGIHTLCHWTPAIGESTYFTDNTQPHYNRENPDRQGLQSLQQELQFFRQKYGVDLLIAEEAAVLPVGCSAETEYLVQAFRQYAAILEQAMARLPAGFLQTAAQRTPSGYIHIGLVRSLEGEVADMPVIQSWQNGEVYLILAMNGDLEQNFYHGISHIIETRILSVCTAFYDWDDLNPKGFAYDNDYKKNLHREDGQYLSGDNQAFVDTFSMSFAREDRARILEHACMPGNESLFRSEIMQKKLQKLCEGIREAFDLEDGTYIWEQYLSNAEASK